MGSHLFPVSRRAKDARPDDLCRVLVEVIELNTGDSAANARGARLAEVTHKVRDREDFCCLLRVARVDGESPVVPVGRVCSTDMS